VGGREPVSLYSGSVLTVRLARIPAIRERYHRRLRSLVERVWIPDRLVAELRRMEAALMPSMLASQRKGYRGLRSNLVDYLRRRGEVLEAALARSKPEPVRDLLPPPTWRVRLRGGKPAQIHGPR